MTASVAQTCTSSAVPSLHTLEATIVGDIGGARYGVYLRIRYVGGDTTYRLGLRDGAPVDERNPTLQVGRQQDTPTPTWDATGGTVTVDAGGLGGTVDATLTSSDSGHPTSSVSGRWQCSAPPPVRASPPAQKLAFSGAVSGGFTGPRSPQGAHFAAATCSSSGSAFNLTVIGAPDDALPRIFSITVIGYHGPGTYREHVAGATVSIELIPGYGDSDTRSWALPEPASESVTITAGERSGSVDATLVSAPPGSPDVTVTGTWSCAPSNP